MSEEELLARHIVDLIWEDIHEEDYDVDKLTDELNKRLKGIMEAD